MAYKFKLKTARLQDLIAVFNSLSPSEIAKIKGEDTMKNIRRADKLIDELQAAYPEDKLNLLIKEVNDGCVAEREAYTALFKEQPESMSAEDRNRVPEVANLLAALNKKLGELSETSGLNEALKAELEVAIGDDERFNLLKEVFERVAADRFRVVKPVAEIWEALEGAEEV